MALLVPLVVVIMLLAVGL